VDFLELAAAIEPSESIEDLVVGAICRKRWSGRWRGCPTSSGRPSS
jgi:hypothetical protein